MIKYHFSFFILIIFSSLASFSFAKEVNDLDKKKGATACTNIELKIQRLECFDTVFSTPIYGRRSNTDKSKSWIRATTSELKRLSGSQPLLSVAENNADVWITIPATNPKKLDAPLLILSCISGISRIELALSEPIDDGRVKVSLGTTETNFWRNDDSGLLLSSGRGVVAIHHIKRMLLTNELVIHSNSPAIDGLHFETDSLVDVIQSVRERCNW
ncbi:MAG: type VI secretion system protein VasI [Bacteriovoracaceae bacterium]|jgi:type VI secretion system protein VasI|tara:strand:+ start:17969 stop:18613 length:645 start_codon:yes stop_codon:yes gene_type:complete